MEDQSSETLQHETAKEFLLEDFKYFSESIWKNEETGETRVKFYITLVTAILAALGALATSVSDPESVPYVLFVSGFALFGLLAFGIITFFRILIRNKATDKYKDKMDDIRKRFTEHTKDSKLMHKYDPFDILEGKKLPKRKFGGLAYTVAAMNSLVLSGLIGVIYFPSGFLLIVNFGAMVFVLSFILQVIVIKQSESYKS